MFKDKITRTFLLVTFIVGLGFQLLYLKDKNQIWLLLSMWAPTIGVFAIWKNGPSVFANLKKIPFKWIIAAILLAFVPHILGQVFTWALGLGDWNSAFVLSADNATISEIKNIKLLLGSGQQSVFFFMMNVFITLLFGGVVTTFVGALGEEIGWRGYLQSDLAKKHGVVLGTFLVGIIWAYWHIPANLGGVNGENNILLTTFVTFPIVVVFMSYPLAWLRLRSDAIWPCAFFHGVNNSLSGFYLIKPSNENVEAVIELVCCILVGSIFIYLLAKSPKNLNEPRA